MIECVLAWVIITGLAVSGAALSVIVVCVAVESFLNVKERRGKRQ